MPFAPRLGQQWGVAPDPEQRTSPLGILGAAYSKSGKRHRFCFSGEGKQTRAALSSGLSETLVSGFVIMEGAQQVVPQLTPPRTRCPENPSDEILKGNMRWMRVFLDLVLHFLHVIMGSPLLQMSSPDQKYPHNLELFGTS